MANPKSLIMGYTTDNNSNNATATYTFCGCLTMQAFTSNYDHDSRGFQAGTLTHMTVRLTANSGSPIFRTRVNASNVNGSISVGASTTGLFSDNSSQDTISSGNNVDIQVSSPSGTIVSIIGFTFQATTAGNTVTRLGCYNEESSFGTTSDYQGPGVTLSENQTEANAKIRMRKAMTIKNMGGLVDASTNTFTAKSRKNGANGTLTGTTTGGGPPSTFVDSSHSDSVIAGDDWNFTYADTSTGGNTDILIFVDFISSNGDCIFVCSNAALTQFNTVVTNYSGLSGQLDIDATESDTEMQVFNAFTFDQLTCNVVGTNGITSASTFSLRADSGGGSRDVISISIGASTSGIFNSASTYQASTSDLMNYKITTGSTGTNLKISFMSVYGNMTTGGGGGAGGPNYQHFGTNSAIVGAQYYQSFGSQMVVFGY